MHFDWTKICPVGPKWHRKLRRTSFWPVVPWNSSNVARHRDKKMLSRQIARHMVFLISPSHLIRMTLNENGNWIGRYLNYIRCLLIKSNTYFARACRSKASCNSMSAKASNDIVGNRWPGWNTRPRITSRFISICGFTWVTCYTKIMNNMMMKGIVLNDDHRGFSITHV